MTPRCARARRRPRPAGAAPVRSGASARDRQARASRQRTRSSVAAPRMAAATAAGVRRPRRQHPRPRAARRRRRSSTSPPPSSVAPAASRAVKRMPFEWPGQHLVAVEQEVHRLVEGDLVTAQQPQPAAAADARKRRLHDRRVESGRIVALEARAGSRGRCNGRGRSARAIHRAARRSRRSPPSSPRDCEVVHEEPRGQHRPHGVRRGRPDADLEDVEYGEIHRAASRRRIRSAISSASAVRSDSSSMLLREHGGFSSYAIVAGQRHLLAREQLRRPVVTENSARCSRPRTRPACCRPSPTGARGPVSSMCRWITALASAAFGAGFAPAARRRSSSAA